MTTGIPITRQQHIFVPVGHQPRRKTFRQSRSHLLGPLPAHHLRFGLACDLKRQLRVIARRDEQRFSVWREPNRVRPVLAAAGDVFQFLDFVELIVAVGVSAAIQPAPRPAVADDVQTVERPQQSLRAGHLLAVDLDVEVLNLGFVVAADGRRSDSAESEVALIADDQPAFRIASHVDPRAKFFFRDREQLLDLKAGQQIEQVALSASGVAAVRVHKILSARMSF